MGSQKVARSESRSIRRERHLWIAAMGWVLLIYSTLYYVRAPIEFLRERNLLRLTVAAIFLLTAATVTFFLMRRRPGRRALSVLCIAAVIYLILFWVMDRAEEKLHLVEYGILAAMIYGALLERQIRRSRAAGSAWSWWPAPVAVLLTSVLGWGDEGIQALLPNRVYDLRDAGLNVAAAVIAVSAIVAWRWAERHPD
jgi:hypothetical protein